MSVAAGSAVVLAVTFAAAAAPANDRIDRAALFALLAGVPVAVGLYALRIPGVTRIGVVLVANGLMWSLTALGGSSDSLAYSIGRVAAWLAFPPLFYLMLAFPDRRIVARAERALSRAVNGVVLVLYAGSALFVTSFPGHVPWAPCGSDCPPNAFVVFPGAAGFVGDVIVPLREVLSVVLLAGVGYVLVQRARAATPMQRRIARPVTVISIASTAMLAFFYIVRRVAPDAIVLRPLGVAWALSAPAIAAAFFVGLMRRRLMLGEVLERMSQTLGHHLDGSHLRASLAAALRDPGLQVLVPACAPGRWRDTTGWETGEDEVPGAGRALTTIGDGEGTVAALVHDPALEDDDELLVAAGSLVVAAVRHERLTRRLETSLDELSDSRARIARAADVERVRIERDLHDGAQQHLIGLRIKLSLAEELMATDPIAAHEAVHELGTGIDLALDELRALAHGVYPSVLSDRGLGDALRSVATATPLPVHLEGEVGRMAAEVETAVYFACVEAIQNAAKHARTASGLWISMHQGLTLDVEIRDDGPGFAPAYGGNGGLRNMRDRVESVGGRLLIESAPGLGTRIAFRVPAR